MKRLSISLFIALILAGCSGGDSSFNKGPEVPPAAGFAITPANGLAVARVTYQSAVSSGDVAGLAGAGLTASSNGGINKPTLQNVHGGRLATLLQKVLLPPVVTDCAADGTVTVTMDLDDPNLLLAGAFTAGDTILAEYDMCDEGLGEVLDGSIDSIVDDFSGNIFAFAYDMTMTMDLVDFSATTGTEMLTVNGDGTATLELLAAPYVAASVSGNSMTTVTNTMSETLTDYSSVQTYDGGVAPAPSTLSAAGTLDSSELAGSVSYSTPVMFEAFDTNYPHMGQLLVVSDASSARLIAQANAVDVVVEIYSNTTGTGTPDSTINTTWAELAAQ